MAMGTLERCHGERRRFYGHTHAGRKWCQMTYFRTPGPPRAKLKGGPGYGAMYSSRACMATSPPPLMDLGPTNCEFELHVCAVQVLTVSKISVPHP